MNESIYQRRLRESHENKEQHRKELEKRHGVVGHKHAARCYELAWEYGHDGGFEEVEKYYVDLVGLLK